MCCLRGQYLSPPADRSFWPLPDKAFCWLGLRTEAAENAILRFRYDTWWGKTRASQKTSVWKRGLVTIRECLSLFPRPGLVLDAVARNYAVGEYSNPNNGCNMCTIFVRCFLCVQNAFAHSGFQRCKRRQMLEKPRGCQNHNIWKRDNLGQ